MILTTFPETDFYVRPNPNSLAIGGKWYSVSDRHIHHFAARWREEKSVEYAREHLWDRLRRRERYLSVRPAVRVKCQEFLQFLSIGQGFQFIIVLVAKIAFNLLCKQALLSIIATIGMDFPLRYFLWYRREYILVIDCFSDATTNKWSLSLKVFRFHFFGPSWYSEGNCPSNLSTLLRSSQSWR